MKTHDKTLLKIIQMLQDIVKRYASHMDDIDNIWHQTMKNDKYVLQMENKVWYLEWVNESLKKKIKQLDPDDTLSDWDWKKNTPKVDDKMKADERSFKDSIVVEDGKPEEEYI